MSIRILRFEVLDNELSSVFSNFFWITYRHNMPYLFGTTFDYDAGWGCMIRSGQMLAASAIATAIIGSNWIVSPMDPLIRNLIINQFLDQPSSPLSIHNAVLIGEQLGRRIGEWHAPSITSRSISQLINEKLTIGIKSICMNDLVIDQEKILPLLEGSKVLVWMPMRLGVENINQLYIEPLKRIISNQFSVGIAGGRPNSSLYFVGYRGDELIYLDPHFSRPSIVGSKDGSLSEEELATYTCAEPRFINANNIDPCFVAGFVIPDIQSYHQWVSDLCKIKSSDVDQLFSLKTGENRDSMEISDEDIVAIDFQ